MVGAAQPVRTMGDRMPVTEVSVVTEDLPESQVGLTIEVPPDRVDQAYDRVLNRLSQRVKIGGFRPGKAPRPLVEARVGPAALRDEVIDFLVPPLVDDALRERGIEAIARPTVEVQELERGRTARVVARVSVWPRVTLPDLDSLRVEKPETTVDDEMVERRLRELREQLAEVEPVEREVREGDVVVGDLKVLVDGEEVPEEARQAVELEVTDGSLVPELRAVLPGKNVGETATATVLQPEDHSNERLRGKQAEVRVTVQGVKEKRVPELTDEVAQQVSNGQQSTAEELRRAAREDLEASARRLDDLANERKVVQAVVEGSQVDVPAALVRRELDREVEDLEHQLGHQGLKLDRYFQYLGKTEEQYRAEREGEARGRITADLVLDEVGKQLAISPTEEEVSDYLRSQAERDPQVKDQLDRLLGNPTARQYFGNRLTRLRTLEALVARASGGAEAGAPAPTAAADADTDPDKEAR
jgi:trigger factor